MDREARRVVAISAALAGRAQATAREAQAQADRAHRGPKPREIVRLWQEGEEIRAEYADGGLRIVETVGRLAAPADGRGVASLRREADAVVARYTDGTVERVGTLLDGEPGEQGEPGRPGVGLASLWADDSGAILAALTDGRVLHVADMPKPEHGADGLTPAAVWNGTRLHFEYPNGAKSDPVDLAGKPGESIRGEPGPGIKAGRLQGNAIEFERDDGARFRVALDAAIDELLRRVPSGGIGSSRARVIAAQVAAENGYLTRAEVAALIEESQMFDDYEGIEYLPDQFGTGQVLTFQFSRQVQFVVVEMRSTLNEDTQAEQVEAQEGRATTGDTVPAADLGAVLKHEIPASLLARTDLVRVLAPVNTRVSVYGKFRPTA